MKISNYFQAWLESYCREWQPDTFSWVARNAKPGTPVDGATVVMLATILNRNITVVSYTEPYIWSADPDKPLDISLGYFGPQQFVPAEVGKKFCYTVFTNKSLIYITYVMLIQVHLNI